MIMEVDNALLTKVNTVSDTVAYFDGDSTGSQWTGTAHASTSINGYFAHGTEEAGGHKAANITYGVGTNVASVLSRFTDTVGNSKQVQTLVVSTASTSNPTTTSTTYVTLTEMDIVNITTFASQIEDISFYGSFTLALPAGALSATMSIILEMGGITQAETELTQMATINNQNLVFTPTFKIANPVFGSHSVRILWLVSSGATATAVGTRRTLRAVSLI